MNSPNPFIPLMCVESHGDDLGSLKRYRTVLTLLSGSTKLPTISPALRKVWSTVATLTRLSPDQEFDGIG